MVREPDGAIFESDESENSDPIGSHWIISFSLHKADGEPFPFQKRWDRCLCDLPAYLANPFFLCKVTI
jgi:hypothetical protein